MVNCPECNKPLKKGGGGESKYYCDNERCYVIYVRHPNEPSKTRVAYTGFARYQQARTISKDSDQKSIRQRLRIFG